AKKSSTKRSASDKAQIPKKANLNRPGQSTDIEGLETDRISKDKTTDRDGIKTGMDTKKWNDSHAGPSLPLDKRPKL
ncbi:hypothetical protein PENTCL1PPCAC_12291, partial [Pristionchus entomophagus]